MMQQFDSLFQMMEAFSDEQVCIDHLRAMRWKKGEFCPYCNCNKLYHFSDKKTFKCSKCRQRFSIKVGTIFEDTKIPLRKWFMAVWMITNHPKGIASTTLAKDLKVTQKTAWFMLHRLRHAARSRSFNAPLSGTVEADESYFGGKEGNKHASKREGGTQGGSGKEIVLGVLERGGEFRAIHTTDLRAKNVESLIEENVQPGSSLMTDEHRSFSKMGERYNHHTVNHSQGEYVRHYVIHTNTIEGAWALLKRQIYGIHHWVSPKHLSRYLGEMTWRINRREFDVGSRMNALFNCIEGRLTYKMLIA